MCWYLPEEVRVASKACRRSEERDMACWPWIDTLQDDAIRDDASRAWYQVADLVLSELWGEQPVGTRLRILEIAEPHS